MCDARKPWMDESGNTYSNAKLKEIQKGWDLKTWEAFLQSDVDVPRQESLLAVPDALENASTGYAEMAREEGEAVEHFPRMQRQIRAYITRLSAQEKRIVRYIFWDGMSQREIAAKCHMSRTAVVNCRDRALKKLGTYFVEDLSHRISASEVKEAQHQLRDEEDLLGA